MIEWPIHGQGESRQWLYPLSGKSNGISEILAVAPNRYLVLERDGRTREQDAKFKHIYLIDTTDATNVESIDHLDPTRLGSGVEAVHKELVIDLLNPDYHIPKRYSLEKPEGLTWGPDLSDGRKTLIVCFDNDFVTGQDSLFLVFALERD